MKVTPPEDHSSNGTTQDHEEEEGTTSKRPMMWNCDLFFLLMFCVLLAEACDISAQLLRTKSDAGVLRRGRRRSPSDQRRIRRHRFSINGHFYNHKVTWEETFVCDCLSSSHVISCSSFSLIQTAVFTPAYGSVTNVRINSCMTTPQVLRVLLNKFKIENSADDFALYLVHASGGQLLCNTESPSSGHRTTWQLYYIGG